MAIIAVFTADRFTVAGLGKDIATNVGLNYERVVMLGVSLVAIVTGVVSVVIGALPFLGLIVPNVVSLALGDNMRRSLPYMALLGGGLLLLCDIVGRVLIYPYEIPVGAVMGCVGSGLFLYLLLRRPARAG